MPFKPSIHMTESDFISITQGGALCDENGCLRPEGFCKAMSDQIRAFTLSLLTDSARFLTEEEEAFSRRGTLKMMIMDQQDLRDQVGLLLGRVDSLARLLQGADHDGGGQAVLSKRLKSLRRRTPTSQPALVRIDACDGIKSSGSCRDSAGPAASRASDGHPPSWQDEWQNKRRAKGLKSTDSFSHRRPSPHHDSRSTPAHQQNGDESQQQPEGAAFPTRSAAFDPAMQGELVWARARIAELEAALNHASSARQTELSAPPPDSSPTLFLREAGDLGESWSGPSGVPENVNKQQGTAVMDSLLHQRGMLRALLREELRDIAKGRKRESADIGSGKLSFPPSGDKDALNCHSAAHSGNLRATLFANHEAALEMETVPPLLAVPHPPSHSPEAKEDQQKHAHWQPHDADPGPSPAYCSGDGSAPEYSSQAEQPSPQQSRRLITGCGSSSLIGTEYTGIEGRYSDTEARSFLEIPSYGASESTHGKASRVTQPRVGDACMSVVLESATEGTNDLVRIVQRRSGGRLRRPSR